MYHTKVLERIIYDKIIGFITKSISNSQFGFFQRRSSLQQLLIFLTNVYNCLNDKIQTDVVYLDFRKAFDSVLHYQLLSKLWTTGILGNLWRWFKAYLSSRTQCGSVNSQHSRFLPVLSGVPQGSILGPLLFLIYINDLPLSTSFSTPLFFADDTKCFRPIRCYIDTCLLQQDLNTFTNWSNDWKISFNESKCTLLRFCSSPQITWQNNYTINHQQLYPMDSHTNLGIVMSADLSWRKHYDLISDRAYKTLGLLHHTLNTTNSVHVKKLLYLSLVRSQLTAPPSGAPIYTRISSC